MLSQLLHFVPFLWLLALFITPTSLNGKEAIFIRQLRFHSFGSLCNSIKRAIGLQIEQCYPWLSWGEGIIFVLNPWNSMPSYFLNKTRLFVPTAQVWVMQSFCSRDLASYIILPTISILHIPLANPSIQLYIFNSFGTKVIPCSKQHLHCTKTVMLSLVGVKLALTWTPFLKDNCSD